MSQKWIQNKKWDDANLTGPLLPVKWVLRTFSSITLAVTVLVGISIYGTLASVPIGLLAQAPTYLLVALSLLVAIVVGAGVPALLTSRVMRESGVSRSWRFLVGLIMFIALGAAVSWAWGAYLWPLMRYDPAHDRGFMLFADFVERYASTTVRRLPGVEMTELQFYGWWPMKTLLFLLVINLIVATVRRIEFRFLNIGVLTVHTGIITIAVGSLLYTSMKLEGDALLTFQPSPAAGSPTGHASMGSQNPPVLVNAAGEPAIGQPVFGFYDREDVALWIDRGQGWEQRPLRGVPRYNDYGLTAAWPDGVEPPEDLGDDGRTLSIDVRSVPNQPGDGDLEFEVVGYASYASNVVLRLVQTDRQIPNVISSPIRRLELILTVPGSTTGETKQTVLPTEILPAMPALRVHDESGLVNIETTIGMSEERWRDLTTQAPPEAMHMLVVEIPGADVRETHAIRQGTTLEIGGYTLEVTEIAPSSPFPIITPGYRGADSSVAIIRVTPPGESPAYDRWVYHRFPELSQELVASTDGSRPKRRGTSDDIRLGFVDMSSMRVYIDEYTDEETGERRVRGVARTQTKEAVVNEDMKPGDVLQVHEFIAVRLGERTGYGALLPTPQVVPEEERERNLIGTHSNAMLAVRISSADGAGGTNWDRVEWLPFMQYLDDRIGGTQAITLPDGRRIRLAFGRVWHRFPNFSVSLVDFKMIPYPHSDTPRDYRSDLLINSGWNQQTDQMRRKTSLNEPFLLRVPYQPRVDAPRIANIARWLVTRVAPEQYKFSQSGWDRAGWMNSKARVERGELKRPYAQWTILGVGNNPGIYIIAFGSVLASLGIPWAFYVKPMILRRRKQKIKEELAASRVKPETTADAAGAGNGDLAAATVHPAGADEPAEAVRR